MSAAPFKPRRLLRAAVELLDGLRSGDSVLLAGLSWEEYVWFDLERTERQRNVLLAYHNGRLGFAANEFLHENCRVRMASLVLEVAMACSAKLIGTGRTTFRRDDLRLCVQADASFYIANWEAVRHLRDIDLRAHPPPDLVIEVEDPRSPLPKLPIHAALGVPEAWVIDQTGATFHWLGTHGEYEPQTTSRSLPMVTSSEVSRLILGDYSDDTAFIAAARDWAETLT